MALRKLANSDLNQDGAVDDTSSGSPVVARGTSELPRPVLASSERSRDPYVEVRGLSHVFYARDDTPTPTLLDFDLQIGRGEFIAIVGPSGCGKTTLLNVASGLLVPSAGTVLIDGEPVSGIQQKVGYMPARDALLPWRTAEGNVEYALEIKRMGDRQAVARDMLRRVGLAGYERRYIGELSQGMRQRVAIARTFATAPQILLMDEPFSALDAQTRAQMHELFMQMWENDRKAVILVTHDVSEAITLADRVIVLSPRPGTIRLDLAIELARPRRARELYHQEQFRQYLAQLWDALGYDTPDAKDLSASHS